jgi:hypothetical protein
MSGKQGQGGQEKHGCYGGKEEHIHQRLQEEDEREDIATGDAREIARELLTDKGFRPDEIQENVSFKVSSADGTPYVAGIDYLVSIAGRPLIAVMCSMAVESRERHVLALARSVLDKPIPFCAVTDGLNAHFLEAASGKLLSKTQEEFPDRAQLKEMAEIADTRTLDPVHRSKETMVLLAFEAASCPRVERK